MCVGREKGRERERERESDLSSSEAHPLGSGAVSWCWTFGMVDFTMQSPRICRA